MDYSLIEAAQDLGCPPISAFWKITLPLAVPGILAGCLLVFIPAVGEFVIPDLLGGSRTLMIGKTLWSEFFNNRDWPLASAVAIILLLLLVVPIVLFQNAQARAQEAGLILMLATQYDQLHVNNEGGIDSNHCLHLFNHYRPSEKKMINKWETYMCVHAA